MFFLTERATPTWNTTVAPTTSRDCLSGEFQCRNGKCINKSKVCDASNDCEDESDEHPPLCPGNVARMLIEPDGFTGQYHAVDGKIVQRKLSTLFLENYSLKSCLVQVMALLAFVYSVLCNNV